MISEKSLKDQYLWKLDSSAAEKFPPVFCLVFLFIVTLHGDLDDLKIDPNVLLLLCTSIPASPLHWSCTGLVVEGA